MAENKTLFYSYAIAFATCLGGFLQSYVTCVIAGALIFIADEFQLSSIQQGNIASFILIGAIIGSLSSAPLADRWGRKWVLFLSTLIYLGTAIGSLFISSLASLFILRGITGLGVGITSMLVPIYLAEIAPASKRGAFVTGFQFFVTIGTLIAYGVNLFCCAHQIDWRWMFFAAAIPAITQLLFFFILPESPKWLLGRGQEKRASLILQRLGLPPPPPFPPLNSEPLFSRPFVLLLSIAIVLSAFQQFSGINAIVYYTPKIFGAAGFSNPQDAIFATLLVGIVNVIATFATFFLIDRFGRRKLLLISQAGVIVGLSLILATFSIHFPFNHWVSVGAVVGYIFLYSLGLGPIVWVLISEIFPFSVRAKALALATFISWVCNYLVVLTFPSLNEILGGTGTFALFAFLSLAAFLFYLKTIPETKGKTLEELEKKFVRRN